MTKKGHQKFWEIDEIFGEMLKLFFGKRLKRLFTNFGKKFGLPRFWSSGSASAVDRHWRDTGDFQI